MLLWIVCLGSVAGLSADHRRPGDFQRIVVFGDSLFDGGAMHALYPENWAPAPWYFHGNFTNGDVMPGHLRSVLEKTNGHPIEYENLSMAGAMTIRSGAVLALIDNKQVEKVQSVIEQVARYPERFSDNDLIVVDGGINNILHACLHPGISEIPLLDIAGDLTEIINIIIAKGGRNIFISNIPPLELGPIVRQNMPSIVAPVFQFIMRAFIQRENKALAAGVDKLKSENPEVKLWVYDINSKGSQLLRNKKIVVNGETYPFEDTLTPCLTSSLNVPVIGFFPDKTQVKELVMCRNPKEHVFYDSIHPTTYANKVFALDIANILSGE